MDFILFEKQLLHDLQFQFETRSNLLTLLLGRKLKNIYTSILPAHVYVYHVHGLAPEGAEKGIRFLGTEVRDSCELWKQNPGSLQDQQCS